MNKTANTLLQNFDDFVKYLQKNTSYVKIPDGIRVNGLININKSKQKASLNAGIAIEHGDSLDLRSKEAWSTVMLILLIKEKEYPDSNIILEKTFQLGIRNGGRLDVFLSNGATTYMIDVKAFDVYHDIISSNKRRGVRQIFSYAFQEKTAKIASYYTYDFANDKHLFSSINIIELINSKNVNDMIRKWDEQYDHKNFIEDGGGFNCDSLKIIRDEDLMAITEIGVKSLKSEFLEILRIHAVSDKPNAFLVLVNMLLCKIYDESKENKILKLINSDRDVKEREGMWFQYVQGTEYTESDECLLKRMQDMYSEASEGFLNKKVIDYTDEEINMLIKGYSKNSQRIRKMFDDLRLKKNNVFAFIEVYDDKTFKDNCVIVKEVVQKISKYKFRYNYRQQFLGDFFEELLVTSIKQDEGQFFTPVPLVDFIIDALPIKSFVENKIKQNAINVLPSAIDYACGAGHFLVAYIDKIQDIINKTDISKRKKIYSGPSFGWIKNGNVVGIEKDYRLAKTTKVASFFNGDGEMDIINADGINKFDSDEYNGTVMWNRSNAIEKFDYVISNPPYSVKGFLRNFKKNKINENDFSLYNDELSDKNAGIEIFFVERAWQLLKKDGYAAILLPQSVLTGGGKYASLRKFMVDKFYIRAMLLTADITFFGTSTSPVVLFMQKKYKESDNDYQTLFMYSNKYMDTKTKKNVEENFLGYKFSNNKKTASVRTISNSTLNDKILPIASEFMDKGKVNKNLGEHCVIQSIQDVTLTDSKQIFPKYKKLQGKPLKEFVIIRDKIESPEDGVLYLEIGDIDNGGIKHSNHGKLKGGVKCQKGDILLSSLTPTTGKICIADKPYVVSSAIFVLAPLDKSKKKLIVNQLKSESVLKQMNSLTEGFKVTYSKISASNLLNYVQIDITNKN